jgi:glutamate dehydrogenase
LKNEILATVLTNDIVNTLGCAFFHQVMEDKGIAPEKIIKAYVIVKEIYEVEKHWKKIESLSNKAPIELQISLFNHLQALVERNILWVLNNVTSIDNVEQTINFFKTGAQKLKNNIKDFVTQSMRDEYARNIQAYQVNKEAYEVGKEICQLRMAKTVMDVVYVSAKSKAKLEDAAKIFFSLGETMHFTWLISQTRSFIPRQYFQSVALRALVSEIQEMQMKLTEDQLKTKKTKSFYENDNYKKYNQFISDLQASGEGSDTLVSMVTIAVNRVKTLAK